MYYETMALVPSRRTVIGLGSNLGDRMTMLDRAVQAIARLPGIEVLGCSSIWESDPLGGPPQPDYCNAAVAVLSSLPPLDLLAALQRIEADFGRVRSVRNGPRTLDLDVLWIEGVHVDEPTLRVPHPRLHERAFALAPLLEVAPEAADPISNVRYAALLAVLSLAGIRRLRRPLDASSA